MIFPTSFSRDFWENYWLAVGFHIRSREMELKKGFQSNVAFNYPTLKNDKRFSFE